MIQQPQTENKTEAKEPKKIGQLLVEDRVITDRQLETALTQQKQINSKSRRKFKLGEVLLFLRYIKIEVLRKYLLKQKPRTQEDAEKLKAIRDEMRAKKEDEAAAKKGAESGLFKNFRKIFNNQ